MKVGDLVRNIHTMRGGKADDHGIIVFRQHDECSDDQHVKVMWFPRSDLVEYMTWMDTDDLEVLNESR